VTTDTEDLQDYIYRYKLDEKVVRKHRYIRKIIYVTMNLFLLILLYLYYGIDIERVDIGGNKSVMGFDLSALYPEFSILSIDGLVVLSVLVLVIWLSVFVYLEVIRNSYASEHEVGLHYIAKSIESFIKGDYDSTVYYLKKHNQYVSRYKFGAEIIKDIKEYTSQLEKVTESESVIQNSFPETVDYYLTKYEEISNWNGIKEEIKAIEVEVDERDSIRYEVITDVTKPILDILSRVEFARWANVGVIIFFIGFILNYYDADSVGVVLTSITLYFTYRTAKITSRND
jgi:hypothetical protein